MKRGGKILNVMLAGVLFGAGMRAFASESRDGPYRGIVTRNVFDLRPPTSLRMTQPSPSVALPPKIILTGITTILGKKIAFLTVHGAKPGSPPEFLMLAEGEAQSEIQVKQIDERAGVVTVVNHGDVQILGFDHDGLKPSEPTGPTVKLPTGPSVSQPVAAAAPLTPEEDAALIEIQRAKMQMEGDPTARILPPTEITETLENGPE